MATGKKNLVIFDYRDRCVNENKDYRIRKSPRISIGDSLGNDVVKGSIFGKTYESDGGHTITPAYGGETIPTPLANRIIAMVDKMTFTRKLYRRMFMPAPTYDMPRQTHLLTTFRGGRGRDKLTELGEDQSSSGISRNQYDSITLTAEKFISYSGYETELREDSLINWAKHTLSSMARSMAEAEEIAVIQGDYQSTTLPAGPPAPTAWKSGDVRYSWNGLLMNVKGTLAGTGNVFTPPNGSSVDHWIDAGNVKLTNQHLQNGMAKIEDQGYRCDAIIMRPNVVARMRDQTEFELFQSIDKIGNRAALINGWVSNWYGAKIIRSMFMPDGSKTGFYGDSTPGNGGEYVAHTDATTVLMHDTRQPIMGDRRYLEIRKRHNFDNDVDEIRMTQRIGMQVEWPEGLLAINNIKNAA